MVFLAHWHNKRKLALPYTTIRESMVPLNAALARIIGEIEDDAYPHEGVIFEPLAFVLRYGCTH